MKQTVLRESFPVYVLEIDREETPFESVDAVCGSFRDCIEAHPSAIFIAELDHLGHTRSLPDERVVKGIRAAGNLVFCFGITLPNRQALAMRPRSIGIAETDDGFVITFIKSPMPMANKRSEIHDQSKRLRRFDHGHAH